MFQNFQFLNNQLMVLKIKIQKLSYKTRHELIDTLNDENKIMYVQ